MMLIAQFSQTILSRLVQSARINNCSLINYFKIQYHLLIHAYVCVEIQKKYLIIDIHG